MGKSLQDQLLSLGLASAEQRPQEQRRKDQIARRSQPSGQQKHPHPRRKLPSDTMLQGGSELRAEPSLEAAYRLREQLVKEQAKRTHEQKRQMDLERRRLNEAIRDIVMPHRLNVGEAELTRNFLYRGRIRKVRVTEEQLKALNAAALGLVYLAGGYHILAVEWVAAVAHLSPDHVPDLSGGDGDSLAEDEEFPVPDDLVW